MHIVFLALRIYPFWAIPLAVVLLQVLIFLKRRKSGKLLPVMLFIGFLVLTSLLWVIFRGDLYSDQWLWDLLGGKEGMLSN